MVVGIRTQNKFTGELKMSKLLRKLRNDLELLSLKKNISFSDRLAVEYLLNHLNIFEDARKIAIQDNV